VQNFTDVYSPTPASPRRSRQCGEAEAVADNVEVKAPEVKPKPPKPSTVGSTPPASGFAVAAP
jgi:hypothetical protein